MIPSISESCPVQIMTAKIPVFIKFFLIFGCLTVLAGCSVHQGVFRMKVPELPEITEAHYRIYDAGGYPASFEAMIRAADKADAVFVGELHNDPVAHFLEAEILKAVHRRYKTEKSRRSVILSLEMFERDVQTVLDEYLSGLITEMHFLNDSRVWGNYFSDYRPLVEFARENKIEVLAANAPRRYVNRVSRLGPEALNDLSPKAKIWLAPLPYPPPSPAYRKKLENLREKGIMSHTKKENSADGKTGLSEAEEKMLSKIRSETAYIAEAQSLWDATMAFSITEALNHNPGSLVLNINGRFHSEQKMGIPEHLIRCRPGTELLTITVLSENCFPNFDNAFKNLGDFIIITDPKLPRTYTGMNFKGD